MTLLVEAGSTVSEYELTDEQVLILAGLDRIGGTEFLHHQSPTELGLSPEDFEEAKDHADYFLDLGRDDADAAWTEFTNEMRERLDISGPTV